MRSKEPAPKLDFSTRLTFGFDQKSSKGFYSCACTANAPQLVCKQFWVESSAEFFTSCTLQFLEVEAFRCLAMSAQPIVHSARKLSIVAHEWWPSYRTRLWAEVLTIALVGRFENLRGVCLSFWTFSDDSFLGRINVLSNPVWQSCKLLAILRTFQQHKLQPALTSVLPIRHNGWHPKGVHEVFGEAVRKELLKYKPISGCDRDKHEEDV